MNDPAYTPWRSVFPKTQVTAAEVVAANRSRDLPSQVAVAQREAVSVAYRGSRGWDEHLNRWSFPVRRFLAEAVKRTFYNG